MDEKEAEKKRSLRNEKLKANRTSETEEQRKERLRIRREKDRARRRTKGKKRSPDTDDYEKQRLKRLKRGEVDLRLEKVVASKQLRLAVETEEERRTRLEAFLKSWQLCLSFKLDVLTTYTPTTERNIDHDLLCASLILLDMYLITYTL